MDETGEYVKANEQDAGEGIIERSLRREEGDGQGADFKVALIHLLSWNRREREGCV